MALRSAWKDERGLHEVDLRTRAPGNRGGSCSGVPASRGHLHWTLPVVVPGRCALSGERITWYLGNDAQASVTEEPDGTWSWHWVPGGTRKSKSHPGFRDRGEAIGAARMTLGEAGIILEPKIGEQVCRNCYRALFDHPAP